MKYFHMTDGCFFLIVYSAAMISYCLTWFYSVQCTNSVINFQSIGNVRTPTTSSLCVCVRAYVSWVGESEVQCAKLQNVLVFRWENLWCFVKPSSFLANCFVEKKNKTLNNGIPYIVQEPQGFHLSHNRACKISLQSRKQHQLNINPFSLMFCSRNASFLHFPEPLFVCERSF